VLTAKGAKKAQSYAKGRWQGGVNRRGRKEGAKLRKGKRGRGVNRKGRRGSAEIRKVSGRLLCLAPSLRFLASSAVKLEYHLNRYISRTVHMLLYCFCARDSSGGDTVRSGKSAYWKRILKNSPFHTCSWAPATKS